MGVKPALPVVVSLLLFAACSAAAQQGAPIWKVGQEWRLLVRPYGNAFLAMHSDPRDNEKALIPRAEREFHVTARVAELIEFDGREYVRIRFAPDADVPRMYWTNPPDPDHLRALQYDLMLDAETGCALALRPTSEHSPGGLPYSTEQVNRVGGYTALLQDAAFPVEWVLSRTDLDSPTAREELLTSPDFRPTPDRPRPNGGLRRVIRPERDGTMRITVGDVSLLPRKKSGQPPREAMRECEQIWRPGEAWWRSYRRYGGGHIRMEAFLVSDPNGSGKPIEPPTSRPRPDPGATDGPRWTVGQEWNFHVKALGRLQTEGDIRACVAELVKEDGRECARIEYKLENDTLPMPSYTLVVDVASWTPIRLECPHELVYWPHATEVGDYRALMPMMPGWPFEWVALRSDLSGQTPRAEFLHFPGLKSVAMFGFQRVISAPEPDGTVRISVGLWVPTQDPRDMTYESAEDALCEVEQIWKPGELWWRSFRRLNHGQVDLEATRIPN